MKVDIKKIIFYTNNKKWILITVFALTISFFILHNIVHIIKGHAFFKKHPEKMVIWELPIETFLSSVTNNFLGKDVDVNIYEIEPGLHYWKIANENEIDIDTIMGCNPFLNSLNAWVGEKIVSINKKGVLHYIQDDEQLPILEKLYNVDASEIRDNNIINIFSKLRKGDIVFIPNAKPRVVTKKMYVQLKKRKLFKVPTNGWVAGRPFGWRMHPIHKVIKFHKGIDMKCPKNTPIFAAADGEVVYTGWGNGYGKMIKIKHENGYLTLYAHCSKIYVRIGDKIKDRQVIGRVGDTGLTTCAHLHFEVRTNGKPVDPMKFLW